MMLTPQEKGVLILAARDSIRSLFGENLQPVIDYTHFPHLQEPNHGAFVTLSEGNQLRGCIGFITSENTLFETVCDAAKHASTNDPRFYPLSEEELPKINIEVSILSELTPISSYEEIQLGVHGLVLEEEYNRGVLLPQVATENGFDLPQFLTALCQKAGLPDYEWESRTLNISTFTATVISEVGERKKTYEQG